MNFKAKIGCFVFILLSIYFEAKSQLLNPKATKIIDQQTFQSFQATKANPNEITELCSGSFFYLHSFSISPEIGYYNSSFFKGGIPIFSFSYTTVIVSQSGDFYIHDIMVFVPDDLEYGSDYSVQVNGSNNFSYSAENITIGNINGPEFSLKNQDGYIFPTKMPICNGTSVPLHAKLFQNDQPYTNGITYQWYKNNVKVGNNINPITIIESGSYRVWAYQGGCSIVSPTIEVEVGTDISANTDIGSETMGICQDNPITISAQHISNTATYQWKKDNINLSSETERTFTPVENGNYSLVVNDNGCSATSICPIIKLGNSLQADIYSFERTLCGGQWIWLFLGENVKNIYKRSDKYGIAINWQKDGVDIVSDGINYYLGPDFRQNFVKVPGKYRLKLTQGNCTTYSNEITLVNGSQFDKPTLKKGAAFPAICHGERYELEWNLAGASAIYKDEVFYVNGNMHWMYLSGTYKLKVGFGTSCANESDPVVISIGNELVPIISTSRNNLCGSTDEAILKMEMAPNTGIFTYQWQKDDSDLPNQTNSTLIVNGNEAGIYKLKVTNGTCNAISNEIIISRNDVGPYEIKSEYNQNNDDFACSNRLASLYFDASKLNSSTEFKWFRNGAEIIGEKSNKLLTPIAGNYTAIAIGSGCSAISTTFSILSDYVENPTLAQSNTEVGNAVTLTAVGCNGTIKWYDAASNGNYLGEGTSFQTEILYQKKSYFAECIMPNCKSKRQKIDVRLHCLNTIFSIKSGNWDNSEIWSCDKIPSILDDVIISPTHIITMPDNYTGQAKNLQNNGNLIFGQNAVLNLTGQ
jgi:hypothetical protein